MNLLEKIKETSEFLKGKTTNRPKIAIVLGTGLGSFAQKIEVMDEIPYGEIPNFKTSTVQGHSGKLIFGKLEGVEVMAMQGRLHYYEGYTMQELTFPIRVMKAFGVQYLMVSNAAGGVNYDFKVGDLMVITDHISHLPNPLIGPNMDEFGPRFPDMTRPYDKSLRMRAFEIAAGLGYELKSGVYFASTGPTYETPAEYKYYRLIGADAVGMSTIPEVIVARHSSIPVFGISVITNEAHDDYAEDYVNDGDDVVVAANAAADKMTTLFTKIIESL